MKRKRLKVHVPPHPVATVEISNLSYSGPAPHRVTATFTLKSTTAPISQDAQGGLHVTGQVSILFKLRDLNYHFDYPGLTGKGTLNAGDDGEKDMPSALRVKETDHRMWISNDYRNRGAPREYRWKLTILVSCPDLVQGVIDPDIENDVPVLVPKRKR